MEPNSAPQRDGGSFEDWGVRRNRRARQLAVHPQGDLPPHEVEPEASCSEDLFEDGQEPQRLHGNFGTDPPLGDFGGPAPLPASAWGSKRGLQQGHAVPSRNTKERTMEDLQQRTQVRKGGASESAPASPPRQRPARRKPRRGRYAAVAPIPALAPQASLKCPVFLEIFSGSGHLGASIAKLTGWYVLLWDITLGEQYDLRSRSKRRMILDWLRGGHIRGGHLGTPGESFSRARDVPPGPPPLRSDQQPMGLYDLKPHDQVKVALGNLFLRFSVLFLTVCGVLGVPATLKNPARSRLWICPPMMALLRKKFCRQFLTHSCGWGKPYKKATLFLGIHVSLPRFELSLCRGSKRGICLFSGKPHQGLVGHARDGRWWTKVSEPYPLAMCDAIAKDFKDYEVQQIASRFERHTTLSA